MKLGILTQPLYINYGGLLQAWALQKSLVRLGHEAWIIRREYIRMDDYNVFHRIASFAYHALLRFLGKEKKSLKITERRRATISQNTDRFINARYSHLTSKIFTERALKKCVDQNGFDGYVVGSDQVWRPKYSPAIGNFFLDFAQDKQGIKRIAYAASFGVEDWEFSDEETKIAANLVKRFDLITVREDSGVNLVEQYFNCKATHVLDPTMLLDKDDYESLIANPTVGVRQSEGDLFCYVLDCSKSVSNAVKACVVNTEKTPYYCNAKKKFSEISDISRLDECVAPPVEQWLKSIADAEMVVTDSFHGAVFSIIFNKPFWVVINRSRGAARFDSLLKMFNLEDRIVINPDITDWNAPIDWIRINTTREYLKYKALAMLNESLK